MLPRLYKQIEENAVPQLRRFYQSGKGGAFTEVPRSGAFPAEGKLKLTLRIPAVLGAGGVVLRLKCDGEEYSDLPFAFTDAANGFDNYSLTIAPAELCGDQKCGLFFFCVLFLRCEHTLFSDTADQVSLRLSETEGRNFRLLFYKPAFDTPAWLRGGVMYHIFVDRFYRGKGKTVLRPDAVLHSSWTEETPEYAEKRGGEIRNNDFFGGNLWGVAEKLPYLLSLGVTCIYLSPVFRAYSNHKYDTGDYETVDEMFGGDAAFRNLLQKAKKAGVHVILDGVFNHTGDDSRYFNRYGRYPAPGAYQSQESPYFPWYTFRHFPDDYRSWWGIPILPKLNHSCEECCLYFTGKDGIGAKYPRAGTAGWRLDVADELPDAFLEEFRRSVKDVTDGEGILIGEVWENAADKIAYGHRRRYFQGDQLDSVMNYPFRKALLSLFVEGDAQGFADTLTEIYASYPKCVCDDLMNLLGTHDTIRILSALGGKSGEGMTQDEAAAYRMTPDERQMSVRRLMAASAVQYAVYGVPSVFYGDEAGMEGLHDPFCRMPFPWGRENKTLICHYQALGQLRKTESVLRDGDFRILDARGAFVAFERRKGRSILVVLCNAGEQEVRYRIPGLWMDMLNGGLMTDEAVLSPVSTMVLKRKKAEKFGNSAKGDFA